MAELRITYSNLTSSGGLYQSPIWLGFHNGGYDLFNTGQIASDALEALAEDGTTSALNAEIDAAQDSSVTGLITRKDGPIAPGRSGSTIVEVSTDVNTHLSWASMVLPSNDAFIGSDDAVELFDSEGDFVGFTAITITGDDVLDAGTELNTETEAAFLNQDEADTGFDEDGVITAHPGFNGSQGKPDGTPLILGGTNGAGQEVTAEAADFTQDDFALGRIRINIVERFEGTDGDDVMTGDNADDIADLGDGDDIALGGSGWDEINGGDGRDIILGQDGADVLIGGKGFDTLIGGAGNDRLIGNSGEGELRGGAGDDTIFGGRQSDAVKGNSGNDRIETGGGRDEVAGGSGDDTILTGSGSDVVQGGSGRDFINGGSGSDELHGGSGRDEVKGGKGNDQISGGKSTDILTGGRGADSFFFGRGYADGNADTITDLNLEEDRILIRVAEDEEDLLIDVVLEAEQATVSYGDEGEIILLGSFDSISAITDVIFTI
ncbi:MAG: hypothetical protein Alpg2KO_09750 [Alphaproteobacteria bacterium]